MSAHGWFGAVTSPVVKVEDEIRRPSVVLFREVSEGCCPLSALIGGVHVIFRIGLSDMGGGSGGGRSSA